MGMFSMCHVCGSDWCTGAECVTAPAKALLDALDVLDRYRAGEIPLGQAVDAERSLTELRASLRKALKGDREPVVPEKPREVTRIVGRRAVKVPIEYLQKGNVVRR